MEDQWGSGKKVEWYNCDRPDPRGKQAERIARAQKNLEMVRPSAVHKMRARHNAERHPLKVIKRLSDLFWEEDLFKTLQF